MARPSRPWFRFYTEAIHDRKMRRLTPAQRWLWVAVLAAARESCQPGRLMVSDTLAYTYGDLADFAGMKAREVAVGMKLLVELGSVVCGPDGAWCVANWNERQFESDDVTARTAKHRSKEQVRNVPTPFLGTPPYTETETDTEPESEKQLAPRPARASDALWDSIIECWRIDAHELTATERGRLNKAVGLLRDVGADPDEIPRRRGVFQRRFPDASATPMAIAGRWAELRADQNGQMPKMPAGTEMTQRWLAEREAQT